MGMKDCPECGRISAKPGYICLTCKTTEIDCAMCGRNKAAPGVSLCTPCREIKNAAINASSTKAKLTRALNRACVDFVEPASREDGEKLRAILVQEADFIQAELADRRKVIDKTRVTKSEYNNYLVWRSKNSSMLDLARARVRKINAWLKTCNERYRENKDKEYIIKLRAVAIAAYPFISYSCSCDASKNKACAVCLLKERWEAIKETMPNSF